jgi:hypothetical protein
MYKISAVIGAAALLVAASAQAQTVSYNARAAAKAFAQQSLRYQYPGAKISVARRPLLSDGQVNGVQAYGINIKKPGKHWQQLKQAVLMRGGFAGWSGTGIADVHYVKTPRENRTRKLKPGFDHQNVIYRTPSSNSITGTRKLQQLASGVARGKRSVAFAAQFGDSVHIPGMPRPMIFPGPSGSTSTQAKVTAPSGMTTTVQKDFHRIVIMNAGANNPQ